MEEASVFSLIPQSDWVASNRSAFAIRDGYPVTEGHTLVITRRQIETWFDASPEEQADIMSLVNEVCEQLNKEFEPDGFNVGFNAGAAAGQTVPHLHVHVIPRRTGDVADPRGGVRFVIPGKGNYLKPFVSPSTKLVDAQNGNHLSNEILAALENHSFDQVDILVSFIMKSGLAIIHGHLTDALDAGANVRVLTTDYMNITDADALSALIDLVESYPPGTDRGSIEVRLFSDPSTSFHPKAYLFSSTQTSDAIGFVGSSNLSRSGIDGGVEWSLGTTDVTPLLMGFDALWSHRATQPLTHDFLRTYRQVWRAAISTPRQVEVPVESEAKGASPTAIQAEALAALHETRAEGHKAGLVVMATGLGKTWLSAFDVEALRDELENAGRAVDQYRVLFVAHREEILTQSRDVFRQVVPDLELGLFYGKSHEHDCDVMFASVQTLSSRLHEFEPDEFDYIIVDEFHHATAPSYRKVIDHFEPQFLLGLTATPQRTDRADLFALCGDNLVFECGLIEGIDRSALVPFRYFGIKDVVDYEPIPWRSGKFDPEMLSNAVQTKQRDAQTLELYEEHCGERTLAFCASIAHADHLTRVFNDAGIPAAAVHSQPESAPRSQSLSQLRDGELRVLCSVDVFNEGLDVPNVDSVMMLRPTESPIIFLQQLGRGLRLSEGKDYLTVVDLVGNHSSFLMKPRVLYSLTQADGKSVPNEVLVNVIRDGSFELPTGCSLHFDVGLIDVLSELARRRSSFADQFDTFCLQFYDDLGERPTAVQAFAAGFNHRSAKNRHDHWFAALATLGLLNESEREVAEKHGDILSQIEREDVTKSYKMVTLRALIAEDALTTGMPMDELARRAHRIVVADPRLVADATSKAIPDPTTASESSWLRLWKKNPLHHLTVTKRGEDPLFEHDGFHFKPRFEIEPELRDIFVDMAAELVEWKMTVYLQKSTVP